MLALNLDELKADMKVRMSERMSVNPYTQILELACQAPGGLYNIL